MENHGFLYLRRKSLQVAAGVGSRGQILEILFVVLEAVTLAAGFGLLGVYISVRYY